MRNYYWKYVRLVSTTNQFWCIEYFCVEYIDRSVIILVDI